MPEAFAATLDAEFLILLPLDQVASQRERLTDHLGRRFRDCSFTVQADLADICGDRGYCVVPIVPTQPDPEGRSGAMIMGQRPEADLVRRVSRAVADFAAGRSGKLN
jgi:hypothetical protein